jgi:alkylhydroperoxidase family enzyme
MNDAPRLPPIPPRQWSPSAREALAILSEEASRIGLDPADDTHVHNLPCTQLHHPELMKRMFPVLMFLLRDLALPSRYRELAILRVAWLRQAEYEWTQHVLIARSCGVADEEIRKLAGGSDPGDWGEIEALILRAVGELLDTTRIADETWDRLMAHLGAQQMVELIHVVGVYDMIAMFMNSTGMELEPGLEEIRFARFVEA